MLKDHLESASRNALYISSTAQNELILCIEAVMRKDFVEEIADAKYFALLADETTDFSKQEQLCVCIRYVKDFKIRERFLCFDQATDLTGAGLAKQILKDSGVDASFMVAQGYDGASAMSGTYNGVQKHIRDCCPNATYIHCFAHNLNLCLSHAASVQSINSAVAAMQATAVFFSESNKRMACIQDFIKSECPESARTRLQQHCQTRWVEKQSSVLTFRELYPAVLAALASLSTCPRSGGKALILSNAITDFS